MHIGGFCRISLERSHFESSSEIDSLFTWRGSCEKWWFVRLFLEVGRSESQTTNTNHHTTTVKSNICARTRWHIQNPSTHHHFRTGKAARGKNRGVHGTLTPGHLSMPRDASLRHESRQLSTATSRNPLLQYSPPFCNGQSSEKQKRGGPWHPHSKSPSNATESSISTPRSMQDAREESERFSDHRLSTLHSSGPPRSERRKVHQAKIH